MVDQIVRVDYARSTLPENCVFPGGREDKEIPIVFSVFVIKAEEKRILVDAGCETMPGFEMEDFITPMAAMKARGVDPADITDVIITHAHHDHIECVKYFSHARVHIQKEAGQRGAKYLTENDRISTFEDEATVCEGVKVVKIGGHAVGSCVVEVEKDGKIYVICGDECYSRYNLEHKVPTGMPRSMENSLAFIEKYTKEPYVCLLCHDI